MSIEQKINEDLKSALKAGQKATILTYRTLLAQIKDERIKLRVKREMTEEDVLGVILNAAKKRKESIDLYAKGNRNDLVEKENAELQLLEKYLPKQMSEEEIAKAIDHFVKQVNASSIQDLGKVMGLAMKELKGKADGQLVQKLVRARLTQD